MKIEYKKEISKITLNLLIGGLLSIMILSARQYYITTYKILDDLESRLAELKVISKKSEIFNNNITTIWSIDSLSMNRLLPIIDTISLKQNHYFTTDEKNRILKISSTNRLVIANDISLIHSLPELPDFYIENKKILQSLIDVLNAENEVWISLDNYLINEQKGNNKSNELLFKKIDYNLINYYNKLNIYKSIYIRILSEKDIISVYNDNDNKTINATIKENKRLQRISFIGIILSFLMLYPIIKISIKEIRKK